MVSTTTIRNELTALRTILPAPSAPEARSEAILPALCAQVVAQVELLGQMADGALPRSDLGPPLGDLFYQLVYLALDGRDGGVYERPHYRRREEHDDQDGKGAPHPLSGEERHRRLEPHGDEEGQEYEHERAAYGVDGGAEGEPEKNTERGHKSDHERVLPVEGLP